LNSGAPELPDAANQALSERKLLEYECSKGFREMRQMLGAPMTAEELAARRIALERISERL
jgi:hypothetical protein